MFWDKKNDKKQILPDLPPMEFPSHLEDSHEMPASYSEPHKEDSNNFDDFSEPSPIYTHTLPSMPDNKDILGDTVSNGYEHEDAYTPSVQSAQSSVNSIESKSSIFIKLDKFQSAKKSLVLLEQKISEMENILKKIRETRLREEQELTAWEKEVSMVKPRIEDISKNLFDKII